MQSRKNRAAKLKDIYNTLYDAFGPQDWWPARTRFEVIVGAILTQNTAWTNVERAIKNLKSAKSLDPAIMHSMSHAELAGHIRPAGYFNIKAKRLKNFLDYLYGNYGGSLTRLLDRKNTGLRQELLSINGIGPETADSIMLYAAGLPEFVIDAYTKRVFHRHGVCEKDVDYEGLKALFMEDLPKDPAVFNEYHALIVRVAKEFCKSRAMECSLCPLKIYL